MTDRSALGAALPSQQQAIRARCVRPTAGFVDFDEGATEQSISARFAQQVARHRDRVAVKAEQRAWTYHELNRMANRVASAILATQGHPAVYGDWLHADAPFTAARDHCRPGIPQGRQILRAIGCRLPSRKTGLDFEGCRGQTARHQHAYSFFSQPIDGGASWSPRRGHAGCACLG